MRDQCGGTEQLMERVSTLGVASHISAGVCMRTLTTILFLGALDFNAFVDAIAHGHGQPIALVADEIKEGHDNLLKTHPVQETTESVKYLSDMLSPNFTVDGIEIDEEYVPHYHDGVPIETKILIGVPTAVVEGVLAPVVEKPVHGLIKGASTAGGKVAFQKRVQRK